MPTSITIQQNNMALTYDEFFEKTGFTKQFIFCKMLNPTRNHFNFQYQLGLNTDSIEFNPSGSCKAGGLYFTINEFVKYFVNYGIDIATIELCEDALFYIDPKGYKFKTNKFNIVKIEQTEEICKIAVKYNGSVLQCVENQTEEMCKIAVRKNCWALQYVRNQTEEICKIAININANVLQYIKKQTEEMCKYAVQWNGLVLRYVKNQTEEICKIAVQQNGLALQYVVNKTEELCKLAVQQNGCALQYVENQTEEICKIAVQRSKMALQYVKEQTEEICEITNKTVDKNYDYFNCKQLFRCV